MIASPGDIVMAHTRAAPPARRMRHVLGEGYKSLCGARPRGGWSVSNETWRTMCPTCERKAAAAKEQDDVPHRYIDSLTGLLDSLPTGHPEKPGVIRAERNMKTYVVELNGECREVYIVQAESQQEARDNWMNGQHQITEASGMEVVSVRLDDQ